MSHTVTVTRTTTTSTTQAVLLNVGYLKTLPGILKVIHVVLGIVVVSLLGHYIAHHKYQYVYRVGSSSYPHVPDHAIFIQELFFLLIATTCLITSTLLLFSCLISIATATIIPKTVLEVIYHLVASLLLIIAAIVYLIYLESEFKEGARVSRATYSGRLAAAVLGIINSIFYAIAVFFAYRHYKTG